MTWCLQHLIWKVFLAIVLLECTAGLDMLEYNKRQGMIPLARLGRKTLLSVLEDKGRSGTMMPFPRLGRTVLELSEFLAQNPKYGRLVTYSVPSDYDFLDADYGSSIWDDAVLETVISNQHVLKKRPKLIPRIGRKKRSVSLDHDDQHQDEQTERESYGDVEMKKPVDESYWDTMEDKRAIFIPRVGRDYNPNRGGPKIKYRQRGLFIPRVGRQSP